MGCCDHSQQSIEHKHLKIMNLAAAKEWEQVFMEIEKPPFYNNGENVMKIKPFGSSLLHVAADQGNIQVIEKLLSFGFAINILDDSDHCAVGFACVKGHLECVKYMVSNGADINIIDIHGHGPLYAAATRDRIDVVKYLVSQNVNIHEKCKDKQWTPAQWARYFKRHKTADYLDNLT
eukprot:11610_1